MLVSGRVSLSEPSIFPAVDLSRIALHQRIVHGSPRAVLQLFSGNSHICHWDRKTWHENHGKITNHQNVRHGFYSDFSCFRYLEPTKKNGGQFSNLKHGCCRASWRLPLLKVHRKVFKHFHKSLPILHHFLAQYLKETLQSSQISSSPSTSHGSWWRGNITRAKETDILRI